MRFKKFNDIENLRHARVEEKPLKNYTGDPDKLSIAKPGSNTSKSTMNEMKEMQGMFKQRNKAIEQSVRNHDPKSEYAIEEYLKENKLELDKNLLLIIFKELVKIDILNHNTQKYININLKPFMGVTLSRGSVCNLNLPKNSLIMQLESDDVDFDIEKKTDETI